VKSKQSSGDERTEENQKQQNIGTDRTLRKKAVFMFSERTWKLVIKWNDPKKGKACDLSNASLTD